jgi:hypothetical protein
VTARYLQGRFDVESFPQNILQVRHWLLLIDHNLTREPVRHKEQIYKDVKHGRFTYLCCADVIALLIVVAKLKDLMVLESRRVRNIQVERQRKTQRGYIKH